MGKSIQQSRRHFGIAKDTGPLPKAQIGRNNDTRSLIELGQQVV